MTPYGVALDTLARRLTKPPMPTMLRDLVFSGDRTNIFMGSKGDATWKPSGCNGH